MCVCIFIHTCTHIDIYIRFAALNKHSSPTAGFVSSGCKKKIMNKQIYFFSSLVQYLPWNRIAFLEYMHVFTRRLNYN